MGTPIKQNNYESRAEHIRSIKSHYKMLWVKLYRSILDILLFYLAFVFFRYGSLFDLPEYGEESGIIGTTMRKVEISVVSEKSKTGLSSILNLKANE